MIYLGGSGWKGSEILLKFRLLKQSSFFYAIYLNDDNQGFLIRVK